MKMAKRGPGRSLVSLVTISETSLEGSQCWHRGLYHVATIKARKSSNLNIQHGAYNPSAQEANFCRRTESEASLEYSVSLS